MVRTSAVGAKYRRFYSRSLQAEETIAPFFDLYTGMVGRPVAACLAEVKARFTTKIGKMLSGT